MADKKILYVHGFGSSGQSGTVNRMRQAMPSATVIAPDLPIHPQEAMQLLRTTCETEHPDLILGTSMGGMYTEMLYGFDRIVINPALRMGDTMVSHNMVGAQHFQNPRLDGVQDFMVTKALVKEYKEMTQQSFSGINEEEQRCHVIGLFGDEDSTVDTFDLFHAHYPRAIRFHGEHRMNDNSFMHSVVPVIRWFDDWQEGRERPIIYIGIEALKDKWGKPLSSSQKAFRQLIEDYAVYIVAPAITNQPQLMEEVMAWTAEYINVPAYDHVVFTNQRNLLYGDYLIDPSELDGAANFMGTRIPFGNSTFKTWEEVIGFFRSITTTN
jgi:hypothetical protein